MFTIYILSGTSLDLSYNQKSTSNNANINNNTDKKNVDNLVINFDLCKENALNKPIDRYNSNNVIHNITTFIIIKIIPNAKRVS